MIKGPIFRVVGHGNSSHIHRDFLVFVYVS